MNLKKTKLCDRVKRYWKLLLSALDYVMTNKKGESTLPDDVIKIIARALLVDAVAFFGTEKGRAEFEEWKRENGEMQKDEPDNRKKTHCQQDNVASSQEDDGKERKAG